MSSISLRVFKYSFIFSIIYLVLFGRSWPLHFLYEHGSLSLLGTRSKSERLDLFTSATSAISKRDPATDYFVRQFRNPEAIMSVLFLVGGDVVQKAIAQMTGGRHSNFTPAIFSFGWVAYAVGSVSIAIGDGVFIPQPESSGLVANVGNVGADDTPEIGSGDRRDNRNWVIGRLIRDLEIKTEQPYRGKHNKLLEKASLLVSVFRLDHCTGKRYRPGTPKKDWLWYSFILVIPCQLILAMLPWIFNGNWSIFLVTSAGNLLAMFTASASSVSKATYKKHSRSSYALTRGNGHLHVFIIQPDTIESYKNSDNNNKEKYLSQLPYMDHMASCRHSAGVLPRVLLCCAAIFWVILLLAIAGLQSDTWYLFGAGLMGMMVNILLAGYPRDPAVYGIPLESDPDTGKLIALDTFGFKTKVTDKGLGVKDVLLELEKKYPGAGHALRGIFFNGLPNAKDKEWHDDSGEEYSLKSAPERLRKKHSLPGSGESRPYGAGNKAENQGENQSGVTLGANGDVRPDNSLGREDEDNEEGSSGG